MKKHIECFLFSSGKSYLEKPTKASMYLRSYSGTNLQKTCVFANPKADIKS